MPTGSKTRSMKTSLSLAFWTVLLVAWTLQTARGHSTNACPFKSCECSKSVANSSSYTVSCTNKQDQGGSGDFPSRDPSSKITNIESLYFGDYAFDKIPDKAFADLHIGRLTFDQNQLKKIGKDSFKNIGSLRELYLHERKLENIQSGSFSPISNSLETINLSDCELDTDELEDAFKEIRQVKSLKSVDVRGNRLSRLSKNLMVGMKNLTVLDLSRNQIKQIDTDTFQDLKSLADLSLSHNNLTSLGSVVKALKRVESTIKKLDLSYNTISTLEIDAYLSGLDELNLASNEITYIGLDCLSGFASLNWLDLQLNRIDRIDPKGLEKLTHLNYINLANNYLDKIPSLAKLEILDELNLQNQNTKLESIQNYAFERNYNPHFMKLDLSQNDLKQFEDKAFCSRNYADAKIDFLKISYLTAEHLDLCVMKQLHLQDSLQSVIIYIDPPVGSSDTNFAEVCSCELFAFAKKYNFFIKGVCDPVFNSTCQNTPFVDKCLDSKYSCNASLPDDNKTTPRPTTPRRTTNSAVPFRHLDLVSLLALILVNSFISRLF